MSVQKDPSILIADAMGPLLQQAMGPYVRKGLFGRWKAGAFEIGYIEGTCDALGNCLFVSEEVATRCYVKILAEYFQVDVFRIPRLISRNPEKYVLGVELGQKRVEESWRKSAVFYELTNELFAELSGADSAARASRALTSA